MSPLALPPAIQGLLGVSKRYPHLATLVPEEDPGRVDLMFGSECIASYAVEDLGTRNALAGMLCSAGLRLADVARLFRLDPRQVRRYARGFAERGLAGLAAQGPGCPRKVTPEIEAFVRAEYRALTRQRGREFRRGLQERVEREFGVRVGFERLRQITAPVRAELRAARGARVGPAGAEAPGEWAAAAPAEAVAPSGGEAGTGLAELSRERLRRGVRTRYAGGLLLHVFLGKLLAGVSEEVGAGARRVFEAFAAMVTQMVGFGATHVERAKALVRREFGVLVGLAASPTLATLRRWLAALAACVDAGRLQARLAANYLEHLVQEKDTFYVDGHFGAYTGEAPLLVGYHPQAHWMEPGRTHYVLCDGEGTPVFFDLDDESDDLRQVIPRHLRRVRAMVGGTEKLTLVFDRGGYSHALFASFDGELDACYIAWEKHDRTDYRRHAVAWEAFDIELQGNDEGRPKVKHLWVAECPREVQVGAWGPRSPIRHHRKLLVRTELRGRGGALKGCRIAPFLSNDPAASAQTLARKLLRRWHEENEFKALRHGYGLDAITSYLTVPYAEAAESDPEAHARVSQREIANPRRKKLDAACRRLARRLKPLEERLARLAAKERRSPGHRRVRDTEAKRDALRAELEALEAKRATEPERINQLRYLVEEGYERPDFARKLLVDLLKVCTRNARREAESVLRLHYLNRRDHVTVLRRMLTAGGTVRLDARGVLRVRLDRLNTAAEDETFAAFLADLNAREPRTLGPASLPLRFDLRRES
ncbi:MAG TPA: helix-turn-helix domain-containing protein [Planctomycetota bacterium]|nr:helix-turn-helix domain-containing protein [Planctomycetota bacterium]